MEEEELKCNIEELEIAEEYIQYHNVKYKNMTDILGLLTELDNKLENKDKEIKELKKVCKDRLNLIENILKGDD